jgi:acylglycerol lipase
MTVADPAGAAGAIEAQVDHVAARDGTSVLTRHWAPTTANPWASFLLVHGLAEHSGRYEHVGAQLAAAGIDTHSFDLRGFGASGGPRASVERWSQLHDDLEERIVAVRSIAPERPLVLYGHSLGGLIALGYVLDGRARPDLLVLSAPAISASIPAWQRALVGSLKRLAPGLLMSNRLDTNDLCDVPEIKAKYVSDPLNQHKSTVRFADAAFAEQRRVAGALDRLAIPTYVVHGALDRIVPTEASAPLEGRASVTRRVYPGIRHELHNEAEGPQVIDGIVDWIREHVSRRNVPGG